MVDELRLTEVLRRAGDSFDVPDYAFERVLAQAGELRPSTPRESRTVARATRVRQLLAAAAGVAVVLGAVSFVQNRVTSTHDTAKTESAGSGLRSDGAGGGAPLDEEAPGSAPVRPGTPAAPARDAARIVRTGSASIEVDEGRFATTMAALTRLADSVDGYVSGSVSSEAGDRPSGSVTLRVPGDRFDQVVADVRGLGEVLALKITAQDVTAEYTDLEARLRALQATRSQFVTLLSKATRIGEVLEVQTRINDVQVQIEQTQGKIRLLEGQTAYGSLKVEVFESGDVLARRVDDGSRLGRAWDASVDRFVGGVAWLVSVAGPLLLILLVLVGGRFAYRLTRRRLV
jgi:hypothetical protein